MDLNEILVFIKVVEAGSFHQAAKLLGMPNSTVSAKVLALEARLGVTLIQRTTRKLFVTEAGRAYYARSVRGLEEIRAAEEAVLEGQAEPQGRLRITAPVELGRVILSAAVALYTKKFPKVTLEFILSDESVDMMGDGVDLAIRAGDLADSSLKARKLGNVHFAVFASKSYLKSAGNPKSPKELEDHAALHFTGLGDERWRLSSGKAVMTANIERKIAMNDLNGLKSLAVAGLGLALLPTFLCHAELRTEKLVRVLPEWKADQRPVHFVFLADKNPSSKLRSFIDTTEAPLRQALAEFGE